MQSPFLEGVQAALSPERFASYRRHGGGDVEALANYVWNTQLCEALYPVLHDLEVALRNAVFNAGASLFGAVAACEVPCWLDADPPILLAGERAKVEAARRGLRGKGKPPEPGRLVAELSFGFWTALFDVRYETSKVLWPRLFRAGVFAGAPRRMRTRKALSPLLNRVRLLRNRAAHHEPIWHWRDLAQQHAVAVELLEWLSCDLRATVDLIDRFAAVHRDGPAAARGRLTWIDVSEIVIVPQAR